MKKKTRKHVPYYCISLNLLLASYSSLVLYSKRCHLCVYIYLSASMQYVYSMFYSFSIFCLQNHMSKVDSTHVSINFKITLLGKLQNIRLEIHEENKCLSQKKWRFSQMVKTVMTLYTTTTKQIEKRIADRNPAFCIIDTYWYFDVSSE